MALQAPTIRASTAVFALAACAAFGLAIRDTAAGRAPWLAAEPAPQAAADAPVVVERDGVPSAAELAAAELEAAEAEAALAAFDDAAAARAAVRRALRRALFLSPDAPGGTGGTGGDAP
jgi:hypothetical protein